jgi:hypothetical protein
MFSSLTPNLRYKDRHPTCSSDLFHLVIYFPEFYIKTQLVPRSKHYISVIQTSQLMLYREINTVCSQIHTKHTNTRYEQNVELLNVKPSGICSDRWAS